MLIVSSSTERPKHSKTHCAEDCEQWIWLWSMYADVKKGRECWTHQTQRRSIKMLGRAVKGKLTGMQMFTGTSMFTWTESMKQLKNKALIIWMPGVHIRKRAPLTNAICKRGCIYCLRQTAAWSVVWFLPVCASVGHMVVWQLCTVVQQTNFGKCLNHWMGNKCQNTPSKM